MNRTAITISLVPEARGGPFVLWGDLDAACRLAREIGYDGVELFAPTAAAVADAAPVLKKHGLALATAGTGAGWVLHALTLASPDPDVRSRARAYIESFIDAAAAQGAPAILGSMQGRWGGDVSRDRALGWLSEAVETFGRRAESRGATFLLEPLNRYEGNLVNTLEDGRRLLDGLSTRAVRLLADGFHMNIEEASVAGALRSAAGLVGHVQLADSNRRPAGQGHTDWPAVAAALRDIGYAGYLSAEALPWPDPGTAARSSMDSIRRYFRCSSTR